MPSIASLVISWNSAENRPVSQQKSAFAALGTHLWGLNGNGDLWGPVQEGHRNASKKIFDAVLANSFKAMGGQSPIVRRKTIQSETR